MTLVLCMVSLGAIVLPWAVHAQTAPTTKPTMHSVICSLKHGKNRRAEWSNAERCAHVRLTQLDPKRLVSFPMGRVFRKAVATPSGCKFSLPLTYRKKTFRCEVRHEGIDYQSRAFVADVKRPATIMIYRRSSNPAGLRFENVIGFYLLRESTRSFFAGIRVYYGLVNRGHVTVDLRKQPLALPMLVPKQLDELGFVADFSAVKTPSIGLSCPAKPHAMEHSAKLGYRFKGVLKPGEGITLVQVINPIQQRLGNLEFVLRSKIPIGGVEFRALKNRFYQPRLSINGGGAIKLTSYQGLTYHTARVTTLRRGAPIVFRIAALPQRSTAAPRIALYIIYGFGLLTLMWLAAFFINGVRHKGKESC